MSRLKAYALYNFVVTAATLILMAWTAWTAGLRPALGASFLLGLIAFSQLFLQRLPWYPEAMSEKDHRTLAGSRPRAMKLFMVMFVPLCAAVGIAVYVKKSEETFYLLAPYIGICSLAFYWFAQAVAILTWREKNEQ